MLAELPAAGSEGNAEENPQSPAVAVAPVDPQAIGRSGGDASRQPAAPIALASAQGVGQEGGRDGGDAETAEAAGDDEQSRPADVREIAPPEQLGSGESSDSDGRLPPQRDGVRVAEPIAPGEAQPGATARPDDERLDGRRAEDRPDVGLDRDEAAGRQRVPPLTMTDVVASTRLAFPSIRGAIAFQAETAGGIVESLGAFDDKLEAFNLNQPLGFYENYRTGVAIKRPLVSGGFLYGGYRLGDGDFASWEGDLETDEGGELKLGFEIPLMRNRLIDRRRTDLGTARLRRGQADPLLFAEVIFVQSNAVDAYWKWVVAGQSVQVAEDLLDLALFRARTLQREVESGAKPELSLIINNQLLAERRQLLIAAIRKYEQAAVKLSFFLRLPDGTIALPDPGALPMDFPEVVQDDRDARALVNAAVNDRPEVEVLRYDLSIAQLELRQAVNMALPEVNLAAEASQDVGGRTDEKGTKQPAKLGVGIVVNQAIQRRKAFGKQQQLRAKIEQTTFKIQQTQDKIATEVQDILVQREAALASIAQAEENLRLAQIVVEKSSLAFKAGSISIVELNIQEEKLATAREKLIKAKGDYFTQQALLELALGNELPLD
jgi:outer membrane protein TolC